MSRLRKQYTVADIVKMGKQGMLEKHERVEVLAGALYNVTPPGKRHAACVKHLHKEFRKQLEHHGYEHLIARAERLVYLNANTSPLPDLALIDINERINSKFGTIPEVVLLTVEVSYTSLGHDLTQKLPIYAAAYIPETWIINLMDKVIEVYLEPDGETYQKRQVYPAGAKLSPTDCPSLVIDPLPIELT